MSENNDNNKDFDKEKLNDGSGADNVSGRNEGSGNSESDNQDDTEETVNAESSDGEDTKSQDTDVDAEDYSDADGTEDDADTDDDSENDAEDDTDDEGDSDYTPVSRFDASAVHHLSGMYKNWFLDYASYVILERAVPEIEDGLKPVQRRILHSMKRMDDGRYNKVANIVGHTMQFHPHGDASIYSALVVLGQKDLLVDTQGNWGNILTGDDAAAPRYIEARLSKFALETVFNPKTTEWQLSYDGRNKEPVTLPVKFPLLLAQGAEGIAVGLASKVLPHNFNDLCDAAVSYLKGRDFHLYPDFPTGGTIDVSKYKDGERGGVVRVRAKIEKLDNKTLVIREVPYGKTASTLQDSITKAIEKGKLKIRKVEDMTASEVEIRLHLAPGASSDKTIDALYAFTDCETNISPNCCVIEDKKPQFLTVSEVLRHSTDRTMGLLRKELEIRKHELEEQYFYSSIERIFIEQRMYKDKAFEQSRNNDEVVAFLDKRFDPFKKNLLRDITRDDYLKLLEIKMQRITRFSSDKADELMAKIKAEIDDITKDLGQMVAVTINWFEYLKKKYGKEHPRRTEIRNFDTIEVAKVAEANEKLYIDRKEGFMGTSLKNAEYVCNCSEFDDIIIFYKDGKYKATRVADKKFIGKNVIWMQVMRKNDKRTTYNVVYRDGKTGPSYIKRFNVPTMQNDRDNDLTQGTPGSQVLYFTANPNGEAETIKITLWPNPNKRKHNIFLEKSFADIGIKGRNTKGNILTKEQVHRIGLKSHGQSTLGGRKVWYDADVRRINYDGHGQLLGEFDDNDRILVVLPGGKYYTTTYDLNHHYEDDIERIEKWKQSKVWTAVLLDADKNGNAYVKRFTIDDTGGNVQSFVGDNPGNRLLLLTDTVYPRLQAVYGGSDAEHRPEIIDAEQFVSTRSARAKGKRISTLTVDHIEELEPLRQPEPEEEPSDDETPQNAAASDEDLDPDAGKSQQDVIDEMTGQLNLFGNKNDASSADADTTPDAGDGEEKDE